MNQGGRQLAALVPLVLVLFGCQPKVDPTATGVPKIVVTYAVLGSVVAELTGEAFQVRSLIPNGLDPHEWEPSARDIEALNKADLVVENGLALEEGLSEILTQVRANGVPFFTVSDHIEVRRVGPGEGLPTGDPDQEAGAEDPHLWLDPFAIRSLVSVLAARLKTDFGVDLNARATKMDLRIAELDGEIRSAVESIAPEGRKLVTGHESLGYFAQRYGFRLIGAIIPSLSTMADSSASQMAWLRTSVKAHRVETIFTEMGTPPKVVEALAREAGVRVVQLETHRLPADSSYFTLMRNLAWAIVGGLAPIPQK